MLRLPAIVPAILLVVLGSASPAHAVITAVFPSNLSYLGGSQINIQGSALPTVLLQVRINGQVAPTTFVSSTLIQATIPSLPIGGPYDVEIWQLNLITMQYFLSQVAPDALTVSGPFAIAAIDPAIILTTDPTTPAVISGAGLTDPTEYTIVSSTGTTYTLDPGSFDGATERQVYVPGGPPAGVYTVRAQLAVPGGPPLVSELVNGFRVSPPASISLFSPSEISYLGQTTCLISGAGFTPQTTVQLDGETIPSTFVTPTRLSCVPPPSYPTASTPFLDVVVSDPVTGSATRLDAVRYRGPLALTSVSPPVVTVTSPEHTLILTGDGFAPGLSVEIAGVERTVGSVSVTEFEVVFDALPVGVHDVTVTSTVVIDAGAPPVVVSVTLPHAITVVSAALPTIDAVDPPIACASGGTAITVRGENFAPETVVLIGGALLQRKTVSIDGTRITGAVPAGSANGGGSDGPVTVTLTDFRGTVEDDAVLSYTSECPSLRGPTEMEAARAYGVARFNWHNPEAYDFIEVLDADGSVIEVLPGDARTYETAALGSQTSLQFQGGIGSAISHPTAAIAKVFGCEYPPPVGGAVTPGELDLALRGGHAPAIVDRCDTGPPLAFPETFRFPQPERKGSPTIGWILPAFTLGLLRRDELVIGFELEQPADRLDIRAFYQRVKGDFGVSLRGRIVQVFPNDGFVDEFTLPDPFIGEERQYHAVTYYRADEDVSSSTAQPCPDGAGGFLQIPAGEYRLEIYTVGGDPNVPYYVFSDDPRDEESFIAGVPCPPYPLVQVRDLSGLRTVPNVTDLVVTDAVDVGTYGVLVDLSARGTWFDFDGSQYSIDPYCDESTLVGTSGGGLTGICLDPPYEPNDAFEYCWTIHSSEPAQCKIDGPETFAVLPDWGCYQVELTVVDKACGISRTYQFDLTIIPEERDLCGPDPFSYRFPGPNPATVEGIIGLVPEPGSGEFEGSRPLAFRFLVVPDCYCTGAGACAAPQLENVQVRLTAAIPGAGSGGAVFGYVPLTGPLTITDLCPDVFDGPKYFQVAIDDLGAIAAHPDLDGFAPTAVYLEGRAVQGGTAYPWRIFGKPMKLFNPPRVLDGAYWNGHFDHEAGAYRFTIKSDPDSVKQFTLPDTGGQSFGLVDAGIPPTSGNVFDAGFSSSIVLSGTQWLDDSGLGLTGGDVMDNAIGGAPDVVDGVELERLPGEPPVWEYCSNRVLFKQEFSQTLFESIIYAGAVGPVPVNIWASVGLGFGFQIKSYLESVVAPFEAFTGGDYYSLDFAVSSEISVSIPCQITADILAGVASVAIRLIPEATFRIIPNFALGYSTSGISSDPPSIYRDSSMDISMELEGCLQTLILGEQCVTVTTPLVTDWEFMGSSPGSPPPLSSCGSSLTGSATGGSFAGGVTPVSVFEAINRPVSVVSPDGSTVVDLWVTVDGGGQLAKINITENGVLTTALEAVIYDNEFFIEPDAAFVSNSEVVIVGSGPPIGWQREPTPIDPANPNYLPSRNRNAAHAEIQMLRLSRASGSWTIDPMVQTSLSDPDAALPAERLVDGRSAVAGDAVNGEAWVAWVRYSDDLLVEAPPPVEPQWMPSLTACLPYYLCPAPVPPFVVEPDLDKATIAVRRVNALGTLPGEDLSVISDPGINIQPSISVAPSGAKTYCAWVHDATHSDLLRSNRGRTIHVAVYDRAANSWSAPFGALEFPDDYPALLEPTILLSGDDEGLLAFTALPASTTSLRDTGLGGGSRRLFVSRIEAGVFGPPEEIRGRCDARVYAWSQVAFLVPNQEWVVGPGLEYLIRQPSEVMAWQEFGPLGTSAGTGNVGITVFDPLTGQWSDATNLFADGTVISNPVGASYLGGIHTVHFSSGLADPAATLLGPVATGFQTHDTPFLPDAAVVSCRLEHSTASPGAIVNGRVTIENRGLAATPTGLDRQSVLALELVFVDSTGTETVQQVIPLETLGIRDAIEVSIAIEMPLDPVVLIARAQSMGIDRDPSNDEQRCYFGAPAPRFLGCSTSSVSVISEPDTYTVTLEWNNPVAYDHLLVYHNGALAHVLPGRVDQFCAVDVPIGDHDFAIRGVVGASKSSPSVVTCSVGPGLAFLRGDANDDGQADISDGVWLLEYLFVGGQAPSCFASGDTNADGGVDISDAVYLLVYLFQFGPALPAPFPACGDSTLLTDETLTCERSGCR